VVAGESEIDHVAALRQLDDGVPSYQSFRQRRISGEAEPGEIDLIARRTEPGDDALVDEVRNGRSRRIEPQRRLAGAHICEHHVLGDAGAVELQCTTEIDARGTEAGNSSP